MIDVDTMFEELGPMTAREKVQLVFILMPAIISALHMAGIIFLGFNQEHVCSLPQQIIQKCNVTWSDEIARRYVPWNAQTNNLDSCLRYKFDTINCTFWDLDSPVGGTRPNETERCDSWYYDTSVFKSAIVSEFDLVCDNKNEARLSQAIFMLGVVFGTAVWGQISDRFGRRIAVFLPMVIGAGVGIATAYANSFLAFTIMRFFIGISIFPSFSCSFVLATETVKKTHKVWVSQTFQAMFGVGVCILPGLAYFVRHWRTFQLCISLPGVVVALLLWCTFESPRWLISSGKYIKANQIVKKHMKITGRESGEAEKLQALSNLQMKNLSTKEDNVELVGGKKIAIIPSAISNETVFDIFKLPNMRRKSFILCYEWMVTSMVYYGLTLNAADLGGDPFLNAFLSAFMEIPACYIAIPMLQRWGRRPTLISSLFLAGAACTCIMFVSQELVWLNVTLSVIGKFSISITFGTVYLYSVDIYPTPVRNVGIGVCNSVARIGAMLAPLIAMLDAVGFAVPYVTLGLLALVGALLGLLLPETAGKNIPETLDEAEQFGKHYEGIMAVICDTKRSNSADDSHNDETKALGQTS